MDNLGCHISLIVFISVVLGGLLMLIFVEGNPTAMDVYRGRTTLEYTIVDGEKVDRVFKKK